MERCIQNSNAMADYSRMEDQWNVFVIALGQGCERLKTFECVE